MEQKEENEGCFHKAFNLHSFYIKMSFIINDGDDEWYLWSRLEKN